MRKRTSAATNAQQIEKVRIQVASGHHRRLWDVARDGRFLLMKPERSPETSPAMILVQNALAPGGSTR
jgi:hypothetical protein